MSDDDDETVFFTLERDGVLGMLHAMVFSERAPFMSVSRIGDDRWRVKIVRRTADRPIVGDEVRH